MLLLTGQALTSGISLVLCSENSNNQYSKIVSFCTCNLILVWFRSRAPVLSIRAQVGLPKVWEHDVL